MQLGQVLSRGPPRTTGPKELWRLRALQMRLLAAESELAKHILDTLAVMSVVRMLSSIRQKESRCKGNHRLYSMKAATVVVILYHD